MKNVYAWDTQKCSQLSVHLENMGFAPSNIEGAVAAVQESGAFDAMDVKPSAIGAFAQSIKTLMTGQSDTQSVSAQVVDQEFASVQ